MEVSVCQWSAMMWSCWPRSKSRTACLPVERVVLEIDDTGVAVGGGVVVIEGGELRDSAAEGWLADPPVEVDDLGLVLFDELGVARQPVARPCFAHPGPVVDRGRARLREPQTTGAPGRRAKRTSDRSRRSEWCGRQSVEEIVLGAMRAESEVQALPREPLWPVPESVALWSHLNDGPVGEVGVVHREAVVMLGDWNDILRAGILEELRPFGRVEFFCAE